MSEESVPMVARMDISEHTVTVLAKKVITAATVHLFVLLTVRCVDTRTDCVLVRQDG